MQPPIPKTKGGLPNVRIIGFTGHRHVKNPEAVATALRDELAAWKKEEGELVAISSVAMGADMIFAQEVIQAGIKWIVVLPMARDLFQNDFPAEAWPKAERLIEQAAEVRILDGTERPEVYVDCGKATVDDSDYLFALWDGKPADGPGGTAQIVAYAQRSGRKLTWFREEETGVKKVDPSKVLSLEFKAENLLETMWPRRDLPPAPESLRKHFKDCDDEAQRTAPNVRISTLSMAGFHLAATLTAGFGLSMHAHLLLAEERTFSLLGYQVHYFPTTVVAIFEVFFISAALWILFLFWRAHKHEEWLQKRRVAEYCRSLLATWHCRDFIDPDSFNEVPELRDVARSALFLRLQKDPGDQVDIEDFRAVYAHDRVMDQLKYFRREGDKAEAKAGPLRVIYLALTLTAFSSTVILLGLRFGTAHLVVKSAVSENWYEQLSTVILDILPLSAPALASFTLAWIAIEDLDRRVGRYRDLQEKMRLTLIDLSLCGTWEGLSHSVKRTERILFHEVLEWYTFSKYTPKD